MPLMCLFWLLRDYSPTSSEYPCFTVNYNQIFSSSRNKYGDGNFSSTVALVSTTFTGTVQSVKLCVQTSMWPIEKQAAAICCQIWQASLKCEFPASIVYPDQANWLCAFKYFTLTNIFLDRREFACNLSYYSLTIFILWCLPSIVTEVVLTVELLICRYWEAKSNQAKRGERQSIDKYG